MAWDLRRPGAMTDHTPDKRTAEQATIQVVGPDISHALIATAAGLVAAIPAVMAYNYFVRRIKVLDSEMETFSNDFLNITKRHFFK